DEAEGAAPRRRCRGVLPLQEAPESAGGGRERALLPVQQRTGLLPGPQDRRVPLGHAAAAAASGPRGGVRAVRRATSPGREWRGDPERTGRLARTGRLRERLLSVLCGNRAGK